MVARRRRSLPGLQLRAWLRADGLRRNASGSDVVDDDETLEAALKALRKLSRELLAERGPALAADEAWRTAFIKQLLAEDTLEEQTRVALQKVPIIPGPSGEFFTLAELGEAAKEGSRLYIATRPYPKGAYPSPTVLLAGGPPSPRCSPRGGASTSPTW